MKIINNGNHVVSTTESSEQTALQPAKTSETAVLVHRGPLKQYADGHAMSGRLRLQVPRFTLCTHADTVGAQATALAQTEKLTVFGMEDMLEFCPQRISQSPCLLDCTALLCQLWIQCFKRREPVSTMFGSKAYGKAIRSLKRAVAGDQLYTVETLGAMMLFYRFMRFSGLYSPAELLPHQLGIRRVIKQIGNPDMKDELHFEVVGAHLFIMYEVIMYHPELMYTEQDYLIQPQDIFNDLDLWASRYSVGGDGQQEEPDDADAGTDDDDSGTDDEEFGTDEDDAGIDDDEDTLLQILGHVFHSNLFRYYRSWLPKLIEIRQDPSRMETRRITFCQKLARVIRKLEATKIWQRYMKLGCITECLAPDFFLGYRFEFASFHIAQLTIQVIMTEVILLRAHYDLGSLGSAPDGDVYKRYLDACARGWLCLPYLHTLDALSTPELLKPLLVTLEPASIEQLSHMLCLDLNWEACGLKNPKDTEGSKAWIHQMAKRMTGRMPQPKKTDSSDDS
ncbi:unnamed protein product [Clonostachys solani]|uniref:Uncharacterized protein n=1 Tax=Clonostachys solani TaxID=160281 RepID=A0A9N9ZBS4_9HYPO|nr:unnamed protein product [Clonostachys solani]